jgi:baseplate hub protein gp41
MLISQRHRGESHEMQYLRFCQITADGGAGTIDVSTLRCRFRISQGTMITPSILKLEVSNILPSTGQQFANKEYAHIKIDAGYQDGHGIIFQGNIVQAIYGRESPTDTLLTVYAADGDHAHNYATVNTTFPPGSTPQQHFNAAIQAMQPFGISQGFVGVDLSTPTYSRAVTLFGMARDVLSNIAKFKQATVSYQQEQVTMVQNGKSAPGGAIVLNSNTGLIGIPTQTIQGILARCLINPSIKVHTQVQINQFDINGGAAAINVAGDTSIGQAQLAHIAADGLYTVYKVDVDGDTRGNPWYQDLAMIATTQVASAPESPTAAATAAPYLGAN